MPLAPPPPRTPTPQESRELEHLCSEHVALIVDHASPLSNPLGKPAAITDAGRSWLVRNHAYESLFKRLMRANIGVIEELHRRYRFSRAAVEPEKRSKRAAPTPGAGVT